jgi:hypothetical protein
MSPAFTIFIKTLGNPAEECELRVGQGTQIRDLVHAVSPALLALRL